MSLNQPARRGLVVAAGAALAAGLAVVAVPLSAGPATAQDAVPYDWRNVEIAGGGFVPNLIFNESEPDLIYARTDIGGAYRWQQSSQRWLPLLDWVGWDNWGWNGVSSLATDPVDPDRVYLAAGMYTNDWDPNQGAILRSSDRGQTWQAAPLPFKLGGNMPGRGMGERLAVDPNRNSVVYFGAPEGNGLWRSTNSGQSWAEVTSFPNPGNWSEDPGDPNGYLSHQPGVVWVTFDPRTGSPGNPTQTIYVGVADLQNTVYRSADGGQSWQRLAGQPTGFMAQQGDLDPVNGYLYITTSDNGGPYVGGNGEVWRFDTAAGGWTEITPPIPLSGSSPYYAHAGLSLDRQDPGTLMVTGYSSWWPDTWIFRSTDSGATWRSFYDVPSWPTRNNHYTQDISAAPWLEWGGQPPELETRPKLGWMTQGLAIDPHDSDRMLYGTGATVYGTTNLTALDTGGTVNIRVMAQGLEETAVIDLAALPGGALVSMLGDIGGFRHTDLATAPAAFHASPTHGTGTSVDFAALAPNWLARVGNTDAQGVSRIGYSTDGGASWFAGSQPGGVTGGGTVAIGADGFGGLVWSPDGAGVHYSTSTGGGFSPSAGVPAGAKVVSDRVDPDRFYAYAGGTVYRSTNGGQTFQAGATNLPGQGFVGLTTVPGVAGDIWLAGETGIFHSTNSGASFTQLPGVSWAHNIGTGAPPPGGSYPALYVVATVDGVTGVFRSDDAGGDWVRINDDRHQWGNMGAAITGDPDVYGRVYLGTNGRGIIYGDPGGAPPTTPPPTSAPPTSPAPTTPPPTTPPPTTGPPTAPPPGNCAVSFRNVNQWPDGFQGEVVITNTGSATVNGWQLAWSFTAGQRLTQLWGGFWQQAGPEVTVVNESWNGTIPPAGSVVVGFTASWQGSNPPPTGFTLSGVPCLVS
jgi:hypothetical protein